MEIMDINVERVFRAWKELEQYGKERVEKELVELTRISKACLTALTGNVRDYKYCYEIYKASYMPELPILQEFFEKLKSISKEGYDFFSEGHNLVALDDYLAFEGKGSYQVSVTLCEFSHYTQYLQHSFKKMFKQTDDNKKRIILKGMIGI